MNRQTRLQKPKGAFRHAVAMIVIISVLSPLVSVEASDDATSLAVEAMTRLQNVDLDQNEKLKQSVLRLLERTRGTPDFLRLVKHFKLRGHENSLLDLAAARPSEEAGVEAMRIVLGGPQRALIEAQLRGPDKARAVALSEALGNSGRKEAVPLLLPVVRDTNRELDLRKQAVRSLGKIEDGARALLQMAKDDQLDSSLRFAASSELSKARWEDVKSAASRILPLPEGQNNQPLPPLAELLRRKGNIENGRRVFTSAATACATCHKVKGEGTDVGPDLSEIGSKLAKEALYESILDPNAGVSFGYEAWQLELDNGEEPFGLIVSETPEEVAVKTSAGIVTRYEKNRIKSRRQMKLSLMPSGLQQAMTPGELVDLIEYLASLKKP